MSDRFVKSSWISCAAVSALGLALALGLGTPDEAWAKKKSRPVEELTNFLLGPDYSLWLVGPIGRIAGDSEVEAYLKLTSDEAAAAFIEEFWAKRRSGDSIWPTDQPQAIYETRAREADRLFTEGARLGRRTDRGTLHVLYGPPEETRYEIADRPGFGPLEVWVYPKKPEKGLDGTKPQRHYYFTKKGETTVQTVPPPRRTLRRPP